MSFTRLGTFWVSDGFVWEDSISHIVGASGPCARPVPADEIDRVRQSLPDVRLFATGDALCAANPGSRIE